MIQSLIDKKSPRFRIIGKLSNTIISQPTAKYNSQGGLANFSM